MTKPDESFWQKYDLWIIGGIIVALVIIIQKKYGKGKRKNSNYTYKQTIKDLIKRKK